jgi:hypothetical protein
MFIVKVRIHYRQIWSEACQGRMNASFDWYFPHAWGRAEEVSLIRANVFSWGISTAEPCLPVSARGRIRVASELPLFWCTDSSWLSPECLSSVRRMVRGCLRSRLHLCIRLASTCLTSNLPLVYTHLNTKHLDLTKISHSTTFMN